ncbi:zeta toxin family protein [Brevibacterium samyangense]
MIPYLDAERSSFTGGQQWPPVLVYTGGQPGAGKSRANERASQARPSLVPIIGDDLRQFHPPYARLMREDPLSMPAATAHASRTWIGMSAEYLREQRADVLIETTLRSPDAMASTIASFRQSGYVVELRVVAVPHEVSRLSMIERYTGQVEANGVGRWTPSAAHDEAFARAVTTVERLVASGAVDRFVIEDRAGTVLFDRSYFGIRDDGLQSAGAEAAVAFEGARAVDQMTPTAAQSWIALASEQITRVHELGQRDRDLLATLDRVRTVDAPALAARAYPEDPKRAREVVRELGSSAVGEPPRRGLP